MKELLINYLINNKLIDYRIIYCVASVGGLLSIYDNYKSNDSIDDSKEYLN